jgi:hypothetical protein
MFHSQQISYSEGYLTLYDGNGEIIVKAIEGLLHSDYIPSATEIIRDIRIGGIPLSRMVKFRPFNIHFSIEYCNPSDLVDLLKIGDEPSPLDLIVPKPRVSMITNQRLSINYPIRNQEYEFSDVVITQEVKDEIEDEDTQFDSIEDIMDRLINAEIDPHLIEQLEKSDENYHDSWISPDSDVNLLRTMTRQVITYQPKKILEKVLNMKYQILSSLVSSINMLNKKTIQAIQRFTNNKYLVYSLIYSYDKQFANSAVPSPNGCELQINAKFDEVYHITPNIDLE